MVTGSNLLPRLRVSGVRFKYYHLSVIAINRYHSTMTVSFSIKSMSLRLDLQFLRLTVRLKFSLFNDNITYLNRPIVVLQLFQG